MNIDPIKTLVAYRCDGRPALTLVRKVKKCICALLSKRHAMKTYREMDV
jgi:hypothetical protein